MHGLNSHTKERIAKSIDDLFDSVALRLVGSIPKIARKKTMLIGFEENVNLGHLFVKAMGNKYLNHVETDMLKGILEGAYSYLDILKNKTINNVIHRIEALARESQVGNERVLESEIGQVLQEEMERARSGLETIAMSEGTKTRNLGSAMDITRAAASDGENDPVVGFSVIRDGSTCKECIRVNLMEDEITPRLYRISEINAGYFKRGDKIPSLMGQHPHCRCTLFMVPSGFGFDKKGHITFVGLNHNELEKQRK